MKNVVFSTTTLKTTILNIYTCFKYQQQSEKAGEEDDELSPQNNYFKGLNYFLASESQKWKECKIN